MPSSELDQQTLNGSVTSAASKMTLKSFDSPIGSFEHTNGKTYQFTPDKLGSVLGMTPGPCTLKSIDNGQARLETSTGDNIFADEILNAKYEGGDVDLEAPKAS